METISRRQQDSSMPSPTPSPLAIHKDSQTISKAKPKIRIIHIFAPKIIKTDVANFRELVQRLTGKPAAHEECCKKKSRIARREEPRSSSLFEKTGLLAGLDTRERYKMEDEGTIMWNGENPGGFFNGFADLDGFIQELGDEFPLFPVDASHLHGFEGTHQLP